MQHYQAARALVSGAKPGNSAAGETLQYAFARRMREPGKGPRTRRHARDDAALWTEKWWFATAEAIEREDWNLSASRYRPETREAAEHRDPRELLAELRRWWEDGDFIADPRSGVNFHVGVTLAVSERFGHVFNYDGFWLLRKVDDRFEPVDLRSATALYPYHWPARLIEPLRQRFSQTGELASVRD